MSKIDKFIRSALNNSNFHEATLAFKRAADAMEKEGINPGDLLQEKGVQSEAEKDLANANDFLQRKVKDLEVRLARASQNRTDASELREAREQAIKWQRLANAKEEDLKSLLPVAAVAQQKVQKLEARLGKVKWRMTALCIVACVVAGSGAYQVAYSAGVLNGENLARSEMSTPALSKGLATAKTAASVKASKTPAAANNLNKATCYIQKKLPRQGQTEKHNVRFWFNNGIVSPVVDGKASYAEASKARYTRDAFLQDINQRWPGKSECRLGVNE